MNRARALTSGVGVIVLMAIFISLGFWQLDRAAKLKELQRPYQEQPTIDLASIAQPSENLNGDAVNRIVRFSGTYVLQLVAPQQRDSNGKTSDWSVALMEVDGGGAILVVRSSESAEMPRGEVSVEGRLFPRQFDDRAEKKDGQLSRIDPGLVSSIYAGSLYDGFVLVRNEVINRKNLLLKRVDLNPARPTVPGFYWQHIVYVVIWWLMAVVVLFLPFYGRWRKRQ